MIQKRHYFQHINEFESGMNLICINVFESPMYLTHLETTVHHTHQHYITARGQALIDRNHDLARHYKLAQIGPKSWICWNFGSIDNKIIKHQLEYYLPEYYRVRTVTLHEEEQRNFMKCTDNCRTRIGVPCECFFNICQSCGLNDKDTLDLGMIDVRHLKLFHSRYGEDNEIGSLLYDAQAQCFEHEGKGVQVSEEFVAQVIGHEDLCYPILGPGTTQTEFDEALFVMERKRNGRNTNRLDMLKYRMEELEGIEIDGLIPLRKLRPGIEEELVISHQTKKMHNNLSKAEERVRQKKKELTMSRSKQTDMYKDWMTTLKDIIEDDRGSIALKETLNTRITEATSEYYDAIDEIWGESKPTRKRKGLEWCGVSSDNRLSKKCRLKGAMG